MAAGLKSMKAGFIASVKESIHEHKVLYDEIKEECTPSFHPMSYYIATIQKASHEWIHIPYFPPFHRPGWLVRYVVGPFDGVYVETLVADVTAGITVALTLIPQALSYAALANLPPIQGLYAAIMPSATYVFLGTSMQLAVGPVAIVSLLTGTLVAKWEPNYRFDTMSATDTAAQASLCTGIILTCMGMLNLGSFIHFISHPVMSGFTTGAAMSIGLSQIKNAFGFLPPLPKTVPQQGMAGFENNYEVMAWYLECWNAKVENGKNEGRFFTNHYAILICFGLYTALICTSLLKQNITATAERKKKISFKIWTICASLTPFAAIIIGARVAYVIKTSPNPSYYADTLKIVGQVQPGIDIFRIPKLRHSFAPFFADCIPITLVLFMESYSVARRIASANNELHILNASQELFANGVSNLIGSVSSAYPVSGSFSRSSLNQVCGAKTPLSKVTTLCVVLIALSTLTKTFFYIPQAALAAVIMVSINSLISFSDLWEAFKHKKKDFIVMLVTLTITFVTETSTGLAVGIGCSVLFYLADLAFSDKLAPVLMEHSKDNNGIDVVKLQGDFTFIQSAKIKDYVTDLHLSASPSPESAATRSERLFLRITTAFDHVLNPHLMIGVDQLPAAIVIDFTSVSLIDLTGLIALTEMFFDARRKGIKMVVVNANTLVEASILKFGITNDSGSNVLGLSRYTALAGSLIPTTVDKIEELVGVYGGDDDEEKGQPNEKGAEMRNLKVMEDKHEAI